MGDHHEPSDASRAVVDYHERPDPNAPQDTMWCASGGLMSMPSLSFAEKVRQARHLDAVLEGFGSESDDENDDHFREREADVEAALSRSARAFAQSAAAISLHGGAADDAASQASTRLESASVGSVPSTSDSFGSYGVQPPPLLSVASGGSSASSSSAPPSARSHGGASSSSHTAA